MRFPYVLSIVRSVKMFPSFGATFGDSLKGEASVVYTNPISMGSSSNAHYGGNAKTYMNVGLAMGEAMVKLIKK